jgi:hypothetical protein
MTRLQLAMNLVLAAKACAGLHGRPVSTASCASCITTLLWLYVAQEKGSSALWMVLCGFVCAPGSAGYVSRLTDAGIAL